MEEKSEQIIEGEGTVVEEAETQPPAVKARDELKISKSSRTVTFSSAPRLPIAILKWPSLAEI